MPTYITPTVIAKLAKPRSIRQDIWGSRR